MHLFYLHRAGIHRHWEMTNYSVTGIWKLVPSQLFADQPKDRFDNEDESYCILAKYCKMAKG